ncbi:hypothetical protein JY97_15790 [Alkalispirochaeta odontotermitis]|nr:hypothetical protein JY97_15790 [Alkalispirochaeta odontotermitis]CAB1074378.1 hypothetical protein D1AOALGA4SA_2197 [Olavius algarvensis Delta 1 endosymbiont]
MFDYIEQKKFSHELTRISTNKWKDRGWWVSVEIDRKPSGRKNEELALDLLANARDRYDLSLESGKILSRGIFTAEENMLGLANLLDIAKQWTGTIIYHKGDLLGTADVQHLGKHLKCAANQAGCRSGSLDQRLAYLGCHLVRIGLLNYSLAALKNGSRYWFSYLKSEKGNNLHVFLDKYALAKAMESSRLCPRFPDEASAIVDVLPPVVNLKPMNNHLFWVPTKYRFRTSWLCRYPPVVPNSEVMYRQWIKQLLQERI